MKKRVLMFIICVTIIFPMVVYGQGTQGKIEKSSYETETSYEEIAMEYMADSVNDKVLTWMEQGSKFKISPLVQNENYGYTRIQNKNTGEQLVIGYAKNASGTYTIIQLVSTEKITKKEIYSYFE